jgi:hypothetical protein
MLQEQGSPDPWEALKAKQAKAAAAAGKANAKSAAIATSARDIGDQHTKAADPEAEHAEALADKYLTPANRLSEATPPTLSATPSAAARCAFSDELMALKPSHLVKRAIAVGVDQTALETAQDGEHPREEIVALIVAKAGENATASSSKPHREQLRDYLEFRGYAPYTEAVVAALYAAEVPSKRWLGELNDIEAEGKLLDFLVGIQKTYTPDGVQRSNLETSVPSGRRSSGIPGLDAAKQSLFDGAPVSPSNAGVDPQPMASPKHDADRSALFTGAKKPADWASSKANTSGNPVQVRATMSRTADGGLNGSLSPSAKVLEAQQRVRQNLESLGDLSDRTKQMEQNSQQFASMATQLRKKKQFGLF